MRHVGLAILSLVCSCATPKKPLNIAVGAISKDMTLALFDSPKGRWEFPLNICIDNCVLIDVDDFGELLQRCKMEQK